MYGPIKWEIGCTNVFNKSALNLWFNWNVLSSTTAKKKILHDKTYKHVQDHETIIFIYLCNVYSYEIYIFCITLIRKWVREFFSRISNNFLTKFLYTIIILTLRNQMINRIKLNMFLRGFNIIYIHENR